VRRRRFAPARCIHASRLFLTKCFQAIDGVTQDKSNLSAVSLKRCLGVCYRTAWRAKQKFVEAIAERESRRLLTGEVVADDASLGGVLAGKPRRGSVNKVRFMAAVELKDKGHPQHVCFDPIPDPKGPTLANWARTALHEAVHLVTDGWVGFCATAAVAAEYGAIILSPRQSPATCKSLNGSTTSSPTSRSRSGALTIISTPGPSRN